MKTNLKREIPLIGLVLTPFVYLALIWSTLPDMVPIHWNLDGEIDRVGSKYLLLLLPILLPGLMYIIFSVIPRFDKKGALTKMGNKYHTIKFIFVLLMTILTMAILYAARHYTLLNPNYMTIGLGFVFTILGNFFQVMRQNKWLGIRTPWTLKNEEVWKQTHKSAGLLWFWGGLAVVISGLVLSHQVNVYTFLCITLIIVIIPITHSYLLYKKITKSDQA